jgi:hypothetical protein
MQETEMLNSRWSQRRRRELFTQASGSDEEIEKPLARIKNPD